MIIKRRNFIWMIPLALMVTFPVWRMPIAKFLTPRGGYDPAYAEIDADAHNFSMDRVKILQSVNGRITADIRAEKAYTTDVEDEYLLEVVDSDIFAINGDITNIIANSGLFNTETQMLTLIDDVVVHKKNDDQYLYTDLLYYNDIDQTVHCPGEVQLTGGRAEVNGNSLDYDIETDAYQIGGRVKVIIEGKVEP